MTIGQICTRDAATVPRETSVADAARLMRHRHVGDLIVTGQGRPVGLVTDRDIVISVVATGIDASVFTVGDLLSRDLVTCAEDLDVFACLRQMRTHGVRRMPVVDKSGMLVGILTLDDLLRVLASELGEVAKLIDREQVKEMKTRV